MSFLTGFCCCNQCPKYEDDFDVEDTSPYLPEGFEKVGAGTLAVESNELTITGANTGILSAEDYPDSIVMVVSWDIVDAFIGAGQQTTLRFVFAYQDADNYHAFEMRLDGDRSSGGFYLYLIERVAGVETTLRDIWWRGAIHNTIPTDHTCNLSFLPAGLSLNYDPVSGWVMLQTFDNLSTAPNKAIHRFATPPTAGKVGFFTTADADQVIGISYVSIFAPIFNCAHGNSSKEFCPDQVGYLCNHSVSPPGDELELTIAGIGAGGACNGSAINGTYVLTRLDYWDGYATKVPYLKEGTGPTFSPWTLEGSIYRYELPVAICNLKFIDVLIYNSRLLSFNPSWLALLDATLNLIGAALLNTVTQTDAGACPECYTIELSGPPVSMITGDRIWSASLTVPTWEYQDSTATAVHLED